jgi:putative ABC transport system permease protein
MDPKPMIFNYLTTALRTIRRSASYTIINVSGLALGITCAILIFSLISYHLNFDNFHANGERIYRFVTEEHRDDIDYEASVPPAFGKAFRDDYTFSEEVARLCSANSLVSFEQDGKTFRFQEDLSFADASYFNIFNFPLASGTNELAQAGTAIISERIAKKYFGDQQAVGKILRFENKVDFRIAGIMKDIPDNTDFRAEILFSYLDVGAFSEWAAEDDAWQGITSSIQTFTRLKAGVNAEDVQNAIQTYVKKFRPNSKNVHHYQLQPLADIHVNTRYGGRISAATLWVLAVIGFFLVFTACLNFINLATAQAVGRSREVGVRKVLGGLRKQLFWQFTLETLVIVLMAFIVSFCVAYAVIPMVNLLLGSRIGLDLSNPLLWAFSLLLIVIVTFLSGAYPGVMLSGFKPSQALKGEAAAGKLNVRRLLITTQFTISQVLLIGLIVVLSQMNLFHNADLGYRRDAIIMIPTGSRDAKTNVLKQQFQQLPNVEQVSLCYSAPAAPYSWSTSLVFDHRTEAEEFASHFKGGDENFLSTFDIDLISGRNLLPSDTVREYLVNESFVKKLGETNESVLGKNLFFNGQYNGPIVGVVSDFHDGSLHSAINPVFITSQINFYQSYAVKINASDVSSTLASLEKTWSAMYPDQVYAHQFLDEQTRQFYQAEETALSVVEIFAFIALLIGAMGLYGLASFMAVRKTKEIGIRKVLGSSVMQILWIFGKEFGGLVLVAFVIAAPVSWLLMKQWLSNFEYKIDMGLWIFALNLVLVALVVIVTVGFRTGKAAMMNPVGALRTE